MRIPSTVVRGQVIPFRTNKRSLVIVNNVSGNTREAISNMDEASERNAEVVCISSGGQLREEGPQSKATNTSIFRIWLSLVDVAPLSDNART